MINNLKNHGLIPRSSETVKFQTSNFAFARPLPQYALDARSYHSPIYATDQKRSMWKRQLRNHHVKIEHRESRCDCKSDPRSEWKLGLSMILMEVEALHIWGMVISRLRLLTDFGRCFRGDICILAFGFILLFDFSCISRLGNSLGGSGSNA
jgi:hypothetical protein